MQVETIISLYYLYNRALKHVFNARRYNIRKQNKTETNWEVKQNSKIIPSLVDSKISYRIITIRSLDATVQSRHGKEFGRVTCALSPVNIECPLLNI